MSRSISRRSFLANTSLGFAATLFPAIVSAEIQRKRVKVHCAAPGGYAYGHDNDSIQGRLVSNKAEEDQVVWNLESLRIEHTPTHGKELLPGQGIATPAASSVFGTSRPATLDYTRRVNGVQQATLPSIHSIPDSAAVPQLVRRKTFTPTSLALDVAFVHLDQIALAIYETGHILCSGRIAHNGGQFQELLGAKVTLQVNVYGEAKNANFAPLSGPILASWKHVRWVSFKSSPEEISLVNVDCDRNIRLKYDEVTHMSVNLVYFRSR